MADKSSNEVPENAYEAAIQYQDRVLEHGRTGKIVIRDEDRPWENTRQGRIRYFLNAAMYSDTALQEWRVFSQEIRTQSGKHRHQGGVSIYILEGKGYTVADGKRYDWEIRKSSHPHVKTDAHTARLDIPVAEDGETKVQYRARFKF